MIFIIFYNAREDERFCCNKQKLQLFEDAQKIQLPSILCEVLASAFSYFVHLSFRCVAASLWVTSV